MSRILLATLVATAVVLPAAAQDRKRIRTVEPVRTERVAMVQGEQFGGQGYASGLPGVGLDGNRATERPSGPGGLSNGVGAVGSLMPNSTSSNGQLLDDEGNGIGFPIGSPRRAID